MDEEWAWLEPLLQDRAPRRGGRYADHRIVINGVFCWARAGRPWRDLPRCYGNWKTVYNQHRRWSAEGTWTEIRDELRRGCDRSAQGTRVPTRPRPRRQGLLQPGHRHLPAPTPNLGDHPERSDQQAHRGSHGGWPPRFCSTDYQQHNTVERGSFGTRISSVIEATRSRFNAAGDGERVLLPGSARRTRLFLAPMSQQV